MPRNKRKNRGSTKTEESDSKDPNRAHPSLRPAGESSLQYESLDIDEFEKEEVVADNMDAEMDEEEDDDDKKSDMKQAVWKPTDGIQEGDELEYDSSAYTCLHRLRVDWPCLSFDILRDGLGYNRQKFPHTIYMVAGTQADVETNNVVKFFKISDIHVTKFDEAENSDDDDDPDNLDDEVILDEKTFAHPGGLYQRRDSFVQQSHILATMADTGKVHLWDASQHIQSLDRPPTQRIPPAKPTFTFDGHRGEGFAVDWSTQVAGRLATGDTYRNIHVWDPHSGSWQVSGVYAGHTASVEDLQWSPTETTVFASCSSDRTIRIFDTRERSRAMLTVEAHAADVNVISWNRKTAHLLLSGSDDGSLKVWDLRAFNAAAPAAHYRWHAAAITSVEWHPVDDSVFAASSADDSVSFWDMGLEEDNDLPVEGADLAGTYVPSQLLFIHRGQSHIKEVHWHPQIPGMCVSTAFDGINYLMPDNLRSLEETDFEGKFLPGYQPPTEGMSGEAGDEKSGGKQQSKKSSRKRSKKASLKNEGTKSADVDMA